MTVADKIRSMTDEEMAKFFDEKNACVFCVFYTDEDGCMRGTCYEGILAHIAKEEKVQTTNDLMECIDYSYDEEGDIP